MKDVFDKPLAIVDVETTGGSPVFDRILEIAIIRVEQGNVVERYSTVVDPEQYVQPTILALTGISEAEIRRAPTFVDIIPTVQALLDGAVFVAHNARFDYGFIKNEFKRLGTNYSADCMCTVKLSRALYPRYKRHDLSTLIERFDFVCENRHRALADADVLLQFLKYSSQTASRNTYLSAIKRVLGNNSIPAQVPSSMVNDLPHKPGVYIFYGKDGEKLYIGKSRNIKARVKSHFASDHASGKEMRLAQETHDIEAIETPGELSALLLESYLIKKELPLYNRMSRYSRKLVVATESTDEQGYKHVGIGEIDSVDLAPHNDVVGVFRSRRQAIRVLKDLTDEHALCPGLMGLESVRRGNKPVGCFYVQLGTCHGACLAQEGQAAYNARHDVAFSDRKIKTWPYSGPVLITEKKDSVSGAGFIVDNWRLAKSFLYDEAGEREFLPANHAFDLDSYKIIASHLVRTKRPNVTVLDKQKVLETNDSLAFDFL